MSRGENSAADEDDGTARLFPVRSEVFRTLFHLCILSWGAYLLLEAWGWQRRDRLFPLIAIALLFCLITGRFVQIWAPQLVPDRPASDGYEIDTGESGRSLAKQELYVVYLLCWLVALTLLIFFIGFVNALVVFIPSFVYFFKRSARMSLVVLVIAYALTYILFILILDIYPWEGYFGVPQLFVRIF